MAAGKRAGGGGRRHDRNEEWRHVCNISNMNPACCSWCELQMAVAIVVAMATTLVAIVAGIMVMMESVVAGMALSDARACLHSQQW